MQCGDEEAPEYFYPALSFSLRLPPEVLHCLKNPYEPSDICPFYIIDRITLFSILYTDFMNMAHDGMEFAINSLSWPLCMTRILAHLKSRDRNTSSIHRLCRTKEYPLLFKIIGSFEGTGHIRSLCYEYCSTLNHRLGVMHVEFMLRRSRYDEFCIVSTPYHSLVVGKAVSERKFRKLSITLL
jgi:hypothetical protein